MKNRKGFTLMELLAMLVVLGILMAVTIPNVTGILSNQRLNSLKNDASQMVESAKIKSSKESTIHKPKVNECLVFTLDYLDDNQDIEKGPNGGDYMEYDSFVLMTREGAQYKYYVRLVEETTDGNFGVHMLSSDGIKDLTNDQVTKIDMSYGLNKSKSSSISQLDSDTDIHSICSLGIQYYVHEAED